MKADWEWRPLGEVCKTGSGATPLKIALARRGDHPCELAGQPSHHVSRGIAVQGVQDTFTFGVGRLAGKASRSTQGFPHAEGARLAAPRFRKRTPKATRSTTMARIPKVESVGMSCTPGEPETDTTISA